MVFEKKIDVRFSEIVNRKSDDTSEAPCKYICICKYILILFKTKVSSQVFK